MPNRDGDYLPQGEFFRQLNDERYRIAREKAREELPCPECGSTDEPVVCTHKRYSADWWDDPLPFMGCSNCGKFLALIPLNS